MLRLYHGATSVCSQKVRITLAEIGLGYDGVLLDLQKGEQFAPDYMALNPEAVVPTLVDDGLVLVESSLIAEYLDKTYNDSRLMPSAGAMEVRTRLWLLRSLAAHAAINALSFSTFMRDRVLATMSPDEIAASVGRIIDPVNREKRRDLYANGLRSVHVAQALRHLRQIFGDMTGQLSGGPWLAGPDYSLADIALAPYVDRIDRLGFDGLWAEEFPKIGGWLAALRARPSYAAAVESFIPDQMAKAQRAGGAGHWPELGAIWRAM